MSDTNKFKTSTWKWVFVGLFVAAVALAVLFYIGWFEQRPVNPDSPAQVEWQNDDHQSLDQVIADPEMPTATPPVAE